MSQKIQATDITEEQAINDVFFDRVDQFIQQANTFCRPQANDQSNPHERRAKVSAAMLFATARFNTWVSANSFENGQQMQEAKAQVMSYLLQQFQAMLEDNYDEYCEQFDNYLRYRATEQRHQNKDQYHYGTQSSSAKGE